MAASPFNASVRLPVDFSARCQSVLSKRLPPEWFDGAEVSCLRIKNERVTRTLEKLRLMFPTIRIRRLLMRAEIIQGPYSPNSPKIEQLLRDLRLLSPRPNSAEVGRGPQSLPFPGSTDSDHDGELVAFYWSVLVAMAALLSVVLQAEASKPDQRAA